MFKFSCNNKKTKEDGDIIRYFSLETCPNLVNGLTIVITIGLQLDWLH
jgi:hypothetical protein